MCDFQSLYFNDDRYVVRCLNCGYYQIAYGTTLLNLSEQEFAAFSKIVSHKCSEENLAVSKETKSIFITTPSQGIYLLLTKKEAGLFYNILEEADNEIKAQALISLFNQ